MHSAVYKLNVLYIISTYLWLSLAGGNSPRSKLLIRSHMLTKLR